ncbi:hypothetical protein niasHT_031784 [Heterodera trifolii]|uniref:Uncharacterized protein n=1 Tax=Heterodera trifolii TaxID=157864 RepID=A0ABD2IQB2_9BILA
MRTQEGQDSDCKLHACRQEEGNRFWALRAGQQEGQHRDCKLHAEQQQEEGNRFWALRAGQPEGQDSDRKLRAGQQEVQHRDCKLRAGQPEGQDSDCKLHAEQQQDPPYGMMWLLMMLKMMNRCQKWRSRQRTMSRPNLFKKFTKADGISEMAQQQQQ